MNEERYLLLKNWLWACSREMHNLYDKGLEDPELKNAFRTDAEKALKELTREKELVEELRVLANGGSPK